MNMTWSINPLLDEEGDRLNAIISEAAFNLRKLLGAFLCHLRENICLSGISDRGMILNRECC